MYRVPSSAGRWLPALRYRVWDLAVALWLCGETVLFPHSRHPYGMHAARRRRCCKWLRLSCHCQVVAVPGLPPHLLCPDVRRRHLLAGRHRHYRLLSAVHRVCGRYLPQPEHTPIAQPRPNLWHEAVRVLSLHGRQALPGGISIASGAGA